jgi:elongation factor Ts
MECKRALEETGGDIEKAAALLKERGQAAAAKRAGREANEGQIASYIHTGGKIGVLIEVNCETDFVARTDEFQRLVRDLAIQVAGLRPVWTTVEAIPAADLDAKRAELMASDPVKAKPEAVRAQIVDGQLKKWFSEVVLVEQPFRDQDRTVGQLIVEAIARTGENIKVRRFVRFELGEEM